MIRKDWKCCACRHDNKTIYWNKSKQPAGPKCRCCGSSKDATAPLRTTRHDDNVLPLKPISFDQRIKDEWDKLLHEIEDEPDDNKCDPEDTFIIDSCPMVQKLFFMMKYYHIHMGKEVVGMEDAAAYRIDCMTDLVEGLKDLSLTALEDMFEHVSTVHRDEEMFKHFIEGIGACSDGAACGNVLRNRGGDARIRHRGRLSNSSRSKPRFAARRPNHVEDDEKLDPVERNILSFFDKWHSFLFHPILDGDNIPDSDIMDDEMIEKVDTMPEMTRETTNKYVDYRFGVWIDYTVNSPTFESMKEEMMGNTIYPMTSKQWQDTLMKALTHLDSDKIKVGKRYKAKRADKKYGIEKGQEMGIMNIMAILMYCNYTDLQRRFTQTFYKMDDNQTEQSIEGKHCGNYYWFGRYDMFILSFLLY